MQPAHENGMSSKAEEVLEKVRACLKDLPTEGRIDVLNKLLGEASSDLLRDQPQRGTPHYRVGDMFLPSRGDIYDVY